MATRSPAQFQNRLSDVGSSSGGRSSGVLVDDGAGGDAKWLLMGMLFFATVSFVMLPVSVFILMDSKKTNANAQAALIEAKKIRAELKPVKKEKENE